MATIGNSPDILDDIRAVAKNIRSGIGTSSLDADLVLEPAAKEIERLRRLLGRFLDDEQSRLAEPDGGRP